MSDERRKSGRLQFLLIAVVFFGPLLGAAWLYYGSSQWLSAGALLAADFSDASDNRYDEGFTEHPAVGQPPADTLWHVTDVRGTDDGHSPLLSYRYADSTTGNYDVGPSSGVIATPTMPLPVLPPGQPLELTFRFFLETEGDPKALTKLRQRLEEMGARSLRLVEDQQVPLTYHFTCLLPVHQSVYCRVVSASDSNPRRAMERVLDEVTQTHSR